MQRTPNTITETQRNMKYRNRKTKKYKKLKQKCKETQNTKRET